MPLNPASFSATQSLADNSLITFTDDSSGSDVTLTVRTIEIQLANGNWVDSDGNESETQVFITWPYSDTSITLSLFPNSTAPSITVRWYAGSVLTYIDDDDFCFNLQDYLFGLQVLQGNTSAPDQVQDTPFYSSMMQYIVNLFNEESAINPGVDIFSSQGAMSRNLWFIQNENMFF